MGIHHTLKLAAAVLLAAVAAPAAGSAAPWSQTTVPGARPVAVDPVLRRVATDVAIEIDGSSRVARYRVQEEFHNGGPRVLEADYLYAVPRGAVLTELALFAGEERLEGEVLEAHEARRIYEEIVRRRRDPALVELAGADLIRARVFPIEAGQTRKIVLHYVQVLPADDGLVRLRYPLSGGLMSPMLETAERPGAGPSTTAPGAASVSLRVRLRDADAFGTPFSPSHRIDVRRHAEASEIEVREASRGDAFELLLPLARAGIGLQVLAHSPAPDSEEGYFLMLLTPPVADTGRAIPRDLTLVLDVSGSMSGRKLEQARNALVRILQGLEPEDRFRVITFASVVRAFRPEPLAATADNIEAATDHLRRLEADGSTNIHDALAAALEPDAAAGRLPLVVFLTDGMPTVSEQNPERIAAAAESWRDGERVFAFGVGADVNTYLLDRLADGGRGASSYVHPDEDVEAAVSTLARKLGAPVLADLRIVDAPVPLEETYPTPLPDLFRGEELVVLGRYRRGGSGELAIEGEGHHRRQRLARRVELPQRQPDNAFIARLWAARKAGALTTRIRLHGPDEETVEALRQLGLRYGILTEYTSFLVQEPTVSVAEGRLRIEAAAEALARPPEAQTGDDAFRRARASSRLGATSTMAEAKEAMAGLAHGGGASIQGGRAWRQVDRRLFVDRDGTWTDAAVRDEDPVLTVAPYGDAWFRLLEALPGLRSAAALGERVKIAGDGLTLHLTPEGRTVLDAADWQRLRAAFPAGS